MQSALAHGTDIHEFASERPETATSEPNAFSQEQFLPTRRFGETFQRQHYFGRGAAGFGHWWTGGGYVGYDRCHYRHRLPARVCDTSEAAMNDKPVPDGLIEHHRRTLTSLWNGAMRWFAISNGKDFGGQMSDRGRQTARINAEEYYSRFEQEAETLLYYLRANGDFVITGPEDSAFKRDNHGINGEPRSLFG
jgi:hypothetical protein